MAGQLQVYVWGRRHQYVNLSFLGIFNFTAPYLPWVLLAFSVVLGSSPAVDLLGMVAGAAPESPHHRVLLTMRTCRLCGKALLYTNFLVRAGNFVWQ